MRYPDEYDDAPFLIYPSDPVCHIDNLGAASVFPNFAFLSVDSPEAAMHVINALPSITNPKGELIRKMEAKEVVAPVENGGTLYQGKRTFASMMGGQGGGAHVNVEASCAKAMEEVMERKYRHLANPDAFQTQVGMAVADKRQMFKNIVREENHLLYQKIKDYLAGISTVLDKVALVLEAKYEI